VPVAGALASPKLTSGTDEQAMSMNTAASRVALMVESCSVT
jgi:hypothetical protein